MERWTELGQVPANFGPTAVTIGNFDGVHRGHQKVLGELVNQARQLGLRSVAITFDPHPSQVHRPDEAPDLITSVDDRLDLLAGTGIDAVLLVHYTLEFAAQMPREFVSRWFAGPLQAQAVVVGRDVRFGRRNSGDINTLRELGGEFGFEVVEIADASGTPDGRRWSSTWVRELLAVGEVGKAAELLGHPHRVSGVVVHGLARGRRLGIPTANLDTYSVGMVPADGVYAGWLIQPKLAETDRDYRLPAAISIGTNPTFDGLIRTVEGHVPGRDDLVLYGDRIILEFVQRLRETLRFESVDALVAQLRADIQKTVEVLRVDL